MENWIVAVIVPVIVAGLMNGAAILLWRSQRGKYKAEAADVLTDASLKIVSRMEKRVEELEVQVGEQDCKILSLTKRVGLLEKENADLRQGSARVVGQIVSLGHEPVWRPGKGEDNA